MDEENLAKIHEYIVNSEFIQSKMKKPLFSEEYVKYIKVPRIKFDKMVEMTRNFYKEYFTLHDVKYMGKNMANSLLLDVSYTVNNKINRKKDPFDLPIIKNRNISDNMLTYSVVRDNLDHLYTCIETPSKVWEKDVPGYAHEITHTQVTAEYDVNDEMLPIFIEKLCADFYKEPFVTNTDIFRYASLLNNLYDYVTFDNYEHPLKYLEETEKYLKSTLKANMLYYLYTSGDNNTKARIIDVIQETFDGLCSVEELCDDFNIDDNKATDLVLIKKYIK